jgi:phage shock protein A
MVRFSVAAPALLCLMASSSTLAFAPHRPLGSSTFVKSSSAKTMPAPHNTNRKNSVSMDMNLFDRFSRVAKSNINNILKNLEDPEKIMNQALEDMQVR